MLGPLIANGRTSQVYRYGNDGAAKVLDAATPQHWAEVEAAFTSSVRQLGVPAPEVRDVTEIDGCAAVIFERVDGPSLWQRMLDAPGDVVALTRELAEVQRAIHAAGVPDALPALTERLRSKFDTVTELDAAERADAHRLLDTMPCGAALLHGDLHPGNVLLAPGGPVVIDWFDATVGHPMADVARTMLLIRRDATDLRHLPGGNDRLPDEISAAYADEVGGGDADRLAAWSRLRAVGRLAERNDDDVAGLLSIWRNDDGSASSPFAAVSG